MRRGGGQGRGPVWLGAFCTGSLHISPPWEPQDVKQPGLSLGSPPSTSEVRWPERDHASTGADTGKSGGFDERKCKNKGFKMPQGQTLKGPGHGSPFSFNPTPMWEQLLQKGDEQRPRPPHLMLRSPAGGKRFYLSDGCGLAVLLLARSPGPALTCSTVHPGPRSSPQGTQAGAAHRGREA